MAFFSSFDYLKQVLDEFRKQHPQIPTWRQEQRMDEAAREASPPSQSYEDDGDTVVTQTVLVGADPNLSHRADPILSQGWKPTLRWSAVDKCSSWPGSLTSLVQC